jgi:hypothetical protein
MTIKEAIISELGFAPANQNVVDKAMVDAGLAEGDTYTTSDSVGVKTATLQVLRILLSTADVTSNNATMITNSIKYDRQAILKRIAALEFELGIVPALPTITSRSIW